MAARAKKHAQLEIDLRVKDPKKAFYSLGFDIASVWYIIYSIRHGTKATIAASFLPESKFSHQAVHKIISGLSEPRANVFGFKIPVAERRQAHATCQMTNPAWFTPTGLTETEDYDFVSTPNQTTPHTHSPNNLPCRPLRLSTLATTAQAP